MKSFVFLYPIPEYIDLEIKNNYPMHGDPLMDDYFKKRFASSKSKAEENCIIKEMAREQERRFRELYKTNLNACINARYRKKGFEINYALFSNHEISDIIKLRDADKLIDVSLSFHEHTLKNYPSNDFILKQLGNPEILRIGGFHMWDCVERLAKKAYKKGIDVLVDEDLTEFFSFKMSDEDFKIDKYPTFKPRERKGLNYTLFMDARKNRPWLWQKY